MDVLFICKERNFGYYDGKYGLWNSANFVADTLNKYGIESKVVSVIDANGIDKVVYENKPKTIILEAIWVPPAKLTELMKRYPTKEWICRVHSKATFLANEGIALQWLGEYLQNKNFIVSCNNKQFNDDMNETHFNSLYLPNIYYYKSSVKPYSHYDFMSGVLDIGCFGSLRPMKNHLNQAIAAIRFADYLDMPLHFHINATRAEQNGQNVLKNLQALFVQNPKHKLVEHGWMPHHEFLSLVERMDIGMQVSLSESFNIVTADFVSRNVPVVASDDIDFVSCLFKAKPTDSDSIVSALKWAYWGSTIGTQRLNKYYLEKYSKEAIRLWLDYFTKYAK